MKENTHFYKPEDDSEVNIPQYVLNRINGNYRDKPIVSDPECDDLAPTCVAHYSKDRGTRLIKDGNRIRPYTVREYARLQGFPDWFEFYGNEESQFTQIGNAVPPMFAYHLAGKVKEYLESRGIL